jgi:aspartate carbamoyltransferase catalytic subunit
MKHLLGLYQVPKSDIARILDVSTFFKTSIAMSPPATFNYLSGRTVVNLFFENSTRTRTSFELAERRLGAASLSLAVAQSSASKGETLLDTMRNIEAMNVDAFVVRHSDAGIPHIMAQHTTKPILNAGDSMHEHPTQALLDMFTLREQFGTLDGLKVLITGDIRHSRVARSNIFGLQTMGATVSVCGPRTLMPRGIEAIGVKVYYDIRKAVADCDAVNVLRIQLERAAGGFIPSIDEFYQFFALTDEVLEHASRKVFVLHPGPMNRETEITSIVADRIDTDADEPSESLILRQVTNGVAVRMACLTLLLNPAALNQPVA